MRPTCRALGELRNDGPRLLRGHWIGRCLSGNHKHLSGTANRGALQSMRLWPHRRINVFVVHNWTAYLLITSVLIHPLILLFSTNSRGHLLDVALPVRSPVQPIENTIGAVSGYLNRGSPTHLIFSASARRNPIDPLDGEKAFVESCFFVVLLTTVWAWRYRLRKDRKEERSETSLWRRLVSALLPAGDQVPAVSEPALPAGGPAQPRRPDR